MVIVFIIIHIPYHIITILHYVYNDYSIYYYNNHYTLLYLLPL